MRNISVTVAVLALASWAEAGLRGGPIVERRRRMSSANELPQHGLHHPGKQPKDIHDLIQASRARQLGRRLPRSDGKVVQYESTDGSAVEYATEREDVMEPPQTISGRYMTGGPGEKPSRKLEQKGKDKKGKDKKDKKKVKKKSKRKPKRKPKPHEIVAKKANNVSAAE